MSVYMKLQSGIIYGPVHSRRIGVSLGINLLPTDRKLCPFDCVYCHYGPDSQWEMQASRLPTPGEVARALRATLQKHPPIDVITFSGNGESTSHPQFLEIVRLVRQERDEHAPSVPLAILSASTFLDRRRVQEGLMLLDRRIMKLDAGDEETFRLVDRPRAGIRVTEVIDGLKRIRPLTLQSLLIQGPLENCSAPRMESLARAIAEVGPEEVLLYTVTRITAEPWVQPLTRDQIAHRARWLSERTGVRVTPC